MVCSAVCPALPAPANAVNCSKQVLFEDFTLPTAINRFRMFPQNIPQYMFSSYWSVSGGVLVSTLEGMCRISPTAPSVMYLSNPSWAVVPYYFPGQAFDFSFTMTISTGATRCDVVGVLLLLWLCACFRVDCTIAGVLGAIFRIQDSINYYYARVDSTSGILTIGKVVAGLGLATPRGNVTVNSFVIGTPLAMAVSMNSTGFTVLVCLLSPCLVTCWAAAVLSSGSPHILGAITLCRLTRFPS